MFTEVQVINLGLSKIASSRISRIDPPRTSLERFIAAGYFHWKRSELTKRRWVFATEIDYALTKVEELEGKAFKYKYALPVQCIRPIRDAYTEWAQRKKFIYSNIDGLCISFVENVSEVDFDPMFVEVLAARVALESAEYVTQSNTKKAFAKDAYDMAVTEAGAVNAFVRGPEDIGVDDNDFPFISSRY